MNAVEEYLAAMGEQANWARLAATLAEDGLVATGRSPT